MHQYIAFLFTSIFYGTYLIKGLSLKRKGIDVNQMAKGEKPRKTFLIELFLASLTYILGISQFVACLIAFYNEEFSSKFFFEANEVLLFSGILFSAVGDKVSWKRLLHCEKPYCNRKNLRKSHFLWNVYNYNSLIFFLFCYNATFWHLPKCHFYNEFWIINYFQQNTFSCWIKVQEK